VIEHPIVPTRVEELAIGSILIQVDAVRFAGALWHHLAQRAVFVREVLTRRDALFADAALDARVVETLFCVHIEEEWVLAQLWHETSVGAFEIATAAFRVHEAVS